MSEKNERSYVYGKEPSIYDQYEDLMSSVLTEYEVQVAHDNSMRYMKDQIDNIKERLYENEILLNATKKSLTNLNGKTSKSEDIEGIKHFQNKISDLVDSMVKSSKGKTITDKDLMKKFNVFQGLMGETVSDLQKMAQIKGPDALPVSDASEYSRILSSMRADRNGLDMKDQEVVRLIKRLENEQTLGELLLEVPPQMFEDKQIKHI